MKVRIPPRGRKKDQRTENRGMVGRYDFGKLFQIGQEKAFKIDIIYTSV